MKKRNLLLASLLTALSTAALAEGKVVVYNWSEYIPDGVLKQFTEETGIKVEYSTYESNEVMYAKLQLQKGKGYDIIVPSTYYIAKMSQEGLLKPIDRKQLTHFKNLNNSLLNKPYDPGNQYSVPYLWGSTGIAYNADVIPEGSITRWADLWDPKWKGQLLLTDDVREVFHMALKINGHSANSSDPKEIGQAYEKLKTLMPNVLVFNSDAPREPYMAGDVNLGMIWNGEAVMAQQEMPNIRYVYPEEGTIFWVDSFAIPSGSENTAEAHKFIDFMLRPEIAKQCSQEVGYATPNRAGMKLLDEKTRNNKTIFPDSSVFETGEFQSSVGDALKLYNDYWEKLKTGH
ncbi:MAG: extracellular solute-binding protein [Hahellaceae bacterium]|nr:extracellular solute-binding protein [Hahellaceae bacterium]